MSRLLRAAQKIFITVTAAASGDDTKSAAATFAVTQPEPDELWNLGGGITGNRQCTLTFETRGGSEIDSLLVNLGEPVNLGEYLSERDGFDLAGWYSDESVSERCGICVRKQDNGPRERFGAHTTGNSLFDFLYVHSEINIRKPPKKSKNF